MTCLRKETGFLDFIGDFSGPSFEIIEAMKQVILLMLFALMLTGCGAAGGGGGHGAGGSGSSNGDGLDGIEGSVSGSKF